MTSQPPMFSDIQSVLDWSLFTSAEAKYQALVAVSENQGWQLKDRISHYTGTAELSKIESQIFDIDITEVPALAWAYERYENLIGMMDAYFGEFTDQERIDHPEFCGNGERDWSFDLAVGFMAKVCGLPGPKCLGWVCKIVSANLRGGLYDP